MENEVFTAAPSELGPRAEQIVTWWMSHYGVERDVAIGTLVTFAHGKGQPTQELFTMFPELAMTYFMAVKKAMYPEEVIEVMPPAEQPAVVSETPVSETPSEVAPQ